MNKSLFRIISFVTIHPQQIQHPHLELRVTGSRCHQGWYGCLYARKLCNSDFCTTIYTLYCSIICTFYCFPINTPYWSNICTFYWYNINTFYWPIYTPYWSNIYAFYLSNRALSFCPLYNLYTHTSFVIQQPNITFVCTV